MVLRAVAAHCTVQIRYYGSPRDTGTGDMRRLEAAIKAGSIDEVYMTACWNGHGVTQQVSKLCKDRVIPCHLLDAAGKVRRKQEWVRPRPAATGSSLRCAVHEVVLSGCHI